MRKQIVIYFIDVPDRGHSAGWVATVGHPNTDGPCGHGATIPDAFNCLMSRLTDRLLENKLRDYATEFNPEEVA